MKNIVSMIIAVLLAASLAAFCACGGRGGKIEATEAPADNIEVVVPTDAPTAAPTAEPTAEPTEEPHFAVDPSLFDKPLADVRTFALEPNIANFKALFPEDFFISLKEMLEEEFGITGSSYADLGVKSFDELVEFMFDSDSVSALFSSASGKKLADLRIEVTDCEQAQVSYVLEHFGEILEFLDPDNVTAAYSAGADITAEFDDGSSETQHKEEMYFYVYDGECYVLFP